MKQIKAIIKKEWLNFLGSEHGVFVVYAVLIFAWSFIPLTKVSGTGQVWWLFFSVIISGNFANTVFVSERLNGSMEILLTSGLTRNAVLYGKILFITIMSIFIGLTCCCIAAIWIDLYGQPRMLFFTDMASGAALYCVGTLMNVACSAWLSIRLQSPRIIPVISILLMAVFVALYYFLTYIVYASGGLLYVILGSAAMIFFFFAKMEFNGERVVHPVDM
jgi:hypothetical protein